MKKISVLLVDDHTMMREALAAIIGNHKDLKVVGEAADGREGAAAAAKLRPDVVALDIAMPNLNGLDAVQHIKARSPASRILILSAHEEDLYIEHAMETGVDGYVSKHAAAKTLAFAIREVAAGRRFFSEAVRRHLSQYEKDAHGPQMHRKPTEKLSSREIEVLQLIAEGNANKQVAAHLGISIKTVEKHRQHVMDKLHIHDTAGLTRYAIAAGLVEITRHFMGSPFLERGRPATHAARPARNR